MKNSRGRMASVLSGGLESLEGRVVLSAVGSPVALHQGTMHVAVLATHKTTTQTSLAIQAGTLGQPITFTVKVRAPASAGAPSGVVNLTDHGRALGTIALTPSTTRGKFAVSTGSATLHQRPGGPAYFLGNHAISATYVSIRSSAGSTVSTTFNVHQPPYTNLANGVRVATIVQGSGPSIQSGQTAGMLYTGYLATDGKIFDDSVSHGGAPFSFKVGSGQVIPGFDAATAGMQVGETRVVMIPAAQGYGPAATGSIPANSDLIFVLTLTSIT